jgi:signal transduction histidine kinase
MGLRIMKSRAGMIGGTLTMKNTPAGGAQVTCEIAIAGTHHKRNERGRKKETPEIPKADLHRR